MKSYKYFSIITGMFSACLVISNILDTKIFQIGETAFPAGIIIFPIVYVFGDIFTEVYGYASSRKAIWTGFFSLVLMVVSFEIARALPAAGFWKNQEAFDLILGKVPRIVAASITAYFLGEFTNSFIMAKLKVIQQGKAIPVRFVVSTLGGQFVDTAVFILIAFLGDMPLVDLLVLFVSAWLFKVLWEILALPISVPLVKWLKKVENVDHYDRDTNFNPFKL